LLRLILLFQLPSQQADYTAIQPLALLLKCILKQRSLSEVFNGGLGSWSLVNMIIAHIMVRVAFIGSSHQHARKL